MQKPPRHYHEDYYSHQVYVLFCSTVCFTPRAGQQTLIIDSQHLQQCPGVLQEITSDPITVCMQHVLLNLCKSHNCSVLYFINIGVQHWQSTTITVTVTQPVIDASSHLLVNSYCYIGLKSRVEYCLSNFNDSLNYSEETVLGLFKARLCSRHLPWTHSQDPPRKILDRKCLILCYFYRLKSLDLCFRSWPVTEVCQISASMSQIIKYPIGTATTLYLGRPIRVDTRLSCLESRNCVDRVVYHESMHKKMMWTVAVDSFVWLLNEMKQNKALC